MQVIKNERIIPYDVDGTLIYYGTKKGSLTVDVYDSVSKKFITVNVNKAMVRLLKEEAHRGGYIVVWSRSGYEWAANVIKALGLTSLVGTVMSKPLVYFDDAEVNTWLKDRVFLEPETCYKTTIKGETNGVS